jgi:hypothetical protein
MSDDASTPETPQSTAASRPYPAGEPDRDPWAAPVADGPQGAPAAPPVALDKPAHGPGATLASGAPPASHEPAPQDRAPQEPAPGPPSVHDQQTVTSLPSVSPAPQPWAGPVAPPVPPAHGSLASFPPPHPATVSGDASVPPPPIAPDGPGQAAYGYPGGYGHPGGYAPAGYGHPAAPPYGWAGPRPMENGMGITAMVLGIVAAAGFCLWPVAIVLGVLAVIFGVIGRGKASRGEAGNPGQALAGIICGAAGTVLGIGLLVVAFVAR